MAIGWITMGEAPESPLQMIKQGKMFTVGATYGHLAISHSTGLRLNNPLTIWRTLLRLMNSHAMYGGAAKALRHSMSQT